MTRRSVYSFGEDSPLKFHISDKLAERYNDAVKKFFKAQQRFNQKFGREWDYVKDPLKIGWTRRENKAWNEFAGIMNRELTAHGPFHINDIMDDYLVKNAGSAVVYVTKTVGRIISTAAMVAVAYELLRRR